MQIKWFAHASFLLEGDGLRIITDPYTPEKSGFAPITEPADIVIRSSDDDSAHSRSDLVPGDPEVITATRILHDGATVKGIDFTAIPTQESMLHKLEPRDNAMYRFTLEGLRILHLGDIGNAFTDAQLEACQDVDIAFVLTGGPPTIELDDLDVALEKMRPRITIPMHYKLPGCKYPMVIDASDFAMRFPEDSVIWHDSAQVEVTPNSLPDSNQVWILKAANAG